MGVSQPIGHYLKLEGEIPAGQTLDVDSFLLSDLKLVKYEISFYNNSEDKFKSLLLRGGKKTGSITHSISSKKGDAMALSLNLVEVTTDGRLRVTNNESFVVSFSILKAFL